jgi:hypothetical protein
MLAVMSMENASSLDFDPGAFGRFLAAGQS